MIKILISQAKAQTCLSSGNRSCSSGWFESEKCPNCANLRLHKLNCHECLHRLDTLVEGECSFADGGCLVLGKDGNAQWECPNEIY